MSTLPSVEAIEYGRGVLTRQVEQLRRFEADALTSGDAEQSERWRRTADWIEWRILGDGKGCVITGFDPRYANPGYRAVVEAAFTEGPTP